jgi:NADH dehydrogenase/NADH:ubiquinone oxidoreductase subunit G
LTLTIDGQAITVSAGTTILQAAQQLDREIPVICYHPTLTEPSLCRICVVEVERSRVLVPACSRPVEEGMVVHTDSERVRRARRLILELLYSTVDLSEAPEIQAYAEAYGANKERFAFGKRREFPVYDDNSFYVRDYSKCIDCWHCVQACGTDVQHTFALTLGERGFDTHIATFFDVPIPESTCVFCGNCIPVCPTGALKGKTEWLLERGVPTDEVWQKTRRKQMRRKR